MEMIVGPILGLTRSPSTQMHTQTHDDRELNENQNHGTSDFLPDEGSCLSFDFLPQSSSYLPLYSNGMGFRPRLD